MIRQFYRERIAMKKRYCGMCDDMTNSNPCDRCGADTDLWPKAAEPLEPVEFRGREAAEFQRETQARIMRELKR